MEKLTLEERKQVALEILIEFDQFCKKHELDYFLGAGTLLGAVRHQGFIPWDDDIDVYMTRENYNTFCAIYKNAEGAYRLLTKDNDPEYYYAFARLCDTRTVGVPRQNLPCAHLGVFVDILPLDGVPKGMCCVKFSDTKQRDIQLNLRKQ